MFVNRVSSSMKCVRSCHSLSSRTVAFANARFFTSFAQARPFTGKVYAGNGLAKRLALVLCVGGSLFSTFKVQVTEASSLTVEGYFKNFKVLKKEENWKEILKQGEEALSIARESNLKREEAKIYAQLTSTAFYMGNYKQALQYVTCCHSLARKLLNPSILVRAFYLESAIYRAMAPKEQDRHTQQMFFLHAVTTCKKAFKVFTDSNIVNAKLEGKLFFNLGAAYADNPEGDLAEAEKCYSEAIKCFRNVEAIEDFVRTSLRLGKVCLLLGDFNRTRQLLDEARPLIATIRVSMHTDYLEGQYAFAMKDYVKANFFVQEGIKKANELGAVVDHKRLLDLQQKIAHLLL